MHALALAFASGCSSGSADTGDTAGTAGTADTADETGDTGDTADTGGDTGDTGTGDTDTADDCLTWWYPDADGDGYGDADGAVEACEAPAGAVATDGDCDDARDDVHPAAVDVCGDDEDQDCDGLFAACADAVDVTLEAADGAVRLLALASEGRPVSVVGDLDGDGRDDFAAGIAATGAPSLAVLARLDALVDLSAAAATWDPGGVPRSWAVLAPAGELTGAGAPALALGSHDGIHLWETPLSGGEFGAPAYAIADDDGSELTHLSEDFAVPGDMDGDGYADLVTSTMDTSSYGDHPEFAYIFRGPIDGDRVTSAADTTIEGEEGVGERGRLAPLGDSDGDGLADFGILVEEQAVYVHGGDVRGTVDREDDAMGVVWVEGGDGLARGGPADLDGDGYDDLVVYEERSGRAVAFRGPLKGTHRENDDAWATWSGLGYAVASVGDTAGDGGDDLLMMTDPEGAMPMALLFTDIAAGSHALGDARRVIRGHSVYAPRLVAAVGDHDGDGLADYLVAGRSASSSPAFLSLFYGE